MAIDAYLTDPRTGRSVGVVTGGALAVAPIHPSLPFNAELATDDVVVNVVAAKADSVFCVTAIFLTGNKNIDQTTASTVSIYTADNETDGVADALTIMLSVPVAKNAYRPYTPVLIEAEEGKWINAVASDDDVFVTILGYYLKVES